MYQNYTERMIQMALMKNHTFGFNIEDSEQREADKWCDNLKKRKALSSYIRDLILADLRTKKNPAPGAQSGIRINVGSGTTQARPFVKTQTK